jgi:endonuclease/exonuclease/phosphatase (EEP) superfamily protein YafD
MESQTPTASPTASPGLTARLVLAATDLHALGVVLYLLLRAISGDRLWPVALVGTFLPWVLLPGVLLLPATLLLRRWRRAALAAVPVIALLWLFGGLFLPRLEPAPACAGGDQGCRALRVMSYNVASGLAGPQQLVEVVRGSDADIVVLLELVQSQADALDRALAQEYPYRVFYPQVVNGKGLLSRYPIREVEGPFRIQTAMTHLRAVVEVDGQLLTVIAAHPPRPNLRFPQGYVYDPGAPADFAALAELATAGGPAILLGDFNTTDQSDNYRLLVDAGLRDAFRTAGQGFGMTFPATFTPLPLVRIDFIWTTADFAALRAWVGPDAGSDHFPVLADLTWRVE